MNYSKQRMLILDIVKNNRIHPTAEWIHTEAKKVIPNIGLATVYRNLRALVELGEIMSINVPNHPERFDGCADTHFHKACVECGNLEDLELKDGEEVYKIEEMVYTMFKDISENDKLNHTLLTGICDKCIQNNKQYGGN